MLKDDIRFVLILGHNASSSTGKTGFYKKYSPRFIFEFRVINRGEFFHKEAFAPHGAKRVEGLMDFLLGF